MPNDGHYGMWSACREVFDDHLPGPGVLQHPRRQLVNGMGRGPRAALIGPVMPQRPRTLLPRRVLCEFYDAITSVLGRVLIDLRRVLACFQRSSTTKDPSFDTTSATAQLVRAKSQHR